MADQQIERVEKPWGHELIWARTPTYVGKVLHIKQGHRLSLQYHRQKVETILLCSGKMTLLIEDDQGALKEVPMTPGTAQHIPNGRRHRMIAVEDCDVFEVSTSQLDDVIRLEDSYGRV